MQRSGLAPGDTVAQGSRGETQNSLRKRPEPSLEGAGRGVGRLPGEGVEHEEDELRR